MAAGAAIVVAGLQLIDVPAVVDTVPLKVGIVALAAAVVDCAVGKLAVPSAPSEVVVSPIT
jgi:hypothetical protein